jgi:hypothetical protein
MRLFKKDTTSHSSSSGSQIARISRMETESLKSWFDTIIMSLGSSYDSWRYHKTPPDQVSEALHVMTEIWNELQSRSS